MNRIIAVIGLALVISALSAASALACATVPQGVWAPNHGMKGNGGSSGDNAPQRHFITCIPDTQGTQNAQYPSPVLEAPCSLD